MVQESPQWREAVVIVPGMGSDHCAGIVRAALEKARAWPRSGPISPATG